MNRRIEIIEELKKSLCHISDVECDQFISYFEKGKRFFFAGAGRSGFVIKGFAMRIMHMGYEAHMTGETTTPNIRENDILLIASVSGNTDSLLTMSRKAKSLKAKILLITANPDSQIGIIADSILHIPGPSPKVAGGTNVVSIQPMASLSEQLVYITLDSLIMQLMERDHMTSEEMFKNHANLE